MSAEYPNSCNKRFKHSVAEFLKFFYNSYRDAAGKILVRKVLLPEFDTAVFLIFFNEFSFNVT